MTQNANSLLTVMPASTHADRLPPEALPLDGTHLATSLLLAPRPRLLNPTTGALVPAAQASTPMLMATRAPVVVLLLVVVAAAVLLMHAALVTASGATASTSRVLPTRVWSGIFSEPQRTRPSNTPASTSRSMMTFRSRLRATMFRNPS